MTCSVDSTREQCDGVIGIFTHPRNGAEEWCGKCHPNELEAQVRKFGSWGKGWCPENGPRPGSATPQLKHEVGARVRIKGTGPRKKWDGIEGTLVKAPENIGLYGCWMVEVPQDKCDREIKIGDREKVPCLAFGIANLELLSAPQVAERAFKVGDEVEIVGPASSLDTIAAPTRAIGLTGKVVREPVLHTGTIYSVQVVIPTLGDAANWGYNYPIENVRHVQPLVEAEPEPKGKWVEVEVEAQEAPPKLEKKADCSNAYCVNGLLRYRSCGSNPDNQCYEWCTHCYPEHKDQQRFDPISQVHVDKVKHGWLIQNKPDPLKPVLVKRMEKRFMPLYTPPTPTLPIGWVPPPATKAGRACRVCGLPQPCFCVGLSQAQCESRV